MKFDNASFTEEGFEKFKTFKKEKQIEVLAGMLNPKDKERAEQLLKRVPNGNISERNDSKASEDNGKRLAEPSSADGGGGQKQGTAKGKD